ncbi:beta-L-arabinofuranosidase domain-containing protein [Streptomyces pristinaespiralis]|uniref:beta-L-arabinofuranosidase domain-containing protein n=1 Tax=Streptomyces pristinaespiralis TaxID=38300 RepID=UPI0038354061
MSSPFGRRQFLAGASLVGALPLLGSSAGTASAASPVTAAGPGPAAPATPSMWTAQPFPLGDAALGAGLFADKRSLVLDFGRSYDVHRLLQVFRANAGLSTRGAVAPGGWEGLDGEARGNLRGHFTGHFLSMLSQAYVSTREQVFADKIGTMVDGLAECREALRRDPAVLSVPGRFTTAAENPRGSYQFVDLPATVLGGASDLTIAVWVRPAHSANWARVWDFGDGTDRYLYLAQSNAAGVPRFAITTAGAAQEQGIDGTAPLPLNRWSHVAVTLRGSVGTLHVDGVAVGTRSGMTLNPAVLGQLANNWLGRSNYASDPVYAGAFCGLDIWSRALTPTELSELQGRPAHECAAGAGDVASYPLEETAGGSFADAGDRNGPAVLRRTWGRPTHPGFLAAYPETQFITLESMTSPDYTVVWAPYYTAHKILKGLLDAHLSTGDVRALDLASGMCDWMHSRLALLPSATRRRMWGLFSSGEYGGMVEAVVDVHSLTGRAEHLELARMFDLDPLIDACAENRDVLSGLHANQHIPIFTGLIRLHDATGEERYLRAARNFWDMVVPTRMYGIGGTSTGEFWRDAGIIAGTLGDTTAETCCAHNMLKLSRLLFLHEQDPKYADHYERTLFNQILGSKQDLADAELPLMTYFIGLAPGAVRDFTPKQGTTCCEGTGIESATKYQDSVYFRTRDGSGLYVNLYTASTLDWTDRGVRVTQTTRFPYQQGSTLRIAGSGTFDLHLRVPHWADAGFFVRVNGRAHHGGAAPGSYLTVSRAWRDGDTVEISMPFTLRTEPALDDHDVQCLMYGPVHLVARHEQREFLRFGLFPSASLSGDLVQALTPVPGRPLHFLLDGVGIAPFFEGTTHAYHAYFRREEPRIVFAGLDSGVENPGRSDGTSFLDEVWAAAPFASQAAFRRHVGSVTARWVGDTLMTESQRRRVEETARRARFT